MAETECKIALVPAYKPDEVLLEVLKGLKTNGFIIVVVNDGSPVEFNNIFTRASKFAEVLTLSENQGKGMALKFGTKFIRDNFKPPYVVTTVDADGQHRITDACRITDEALKNPDKMVIGKRNLKLEGTPLRSKIGNNITHFGFRQATLTHLNETQTGLRAFSDRIIDTVIDVKGSRYEYEMIVLMTLARKGIKIIETDIETVYEEGNSSSHFNPLPDSVRIYSSILKFAWTAVLCFVIDLAVFSCVFVGLNGVNLWHENHASVFSLIILSNIIARALSTCFDLVINKRVLFKNVKSKPKAVILYILLLITVFAADTAIVALLSLAGVIPFVGKIISMLLITWLSRIIQTKIFEL